MAKTHRELSVPEHIATYVDKKSKAKSFVLPFRFPDGISGVVIITKLDSGIWEPAKDIKLITLDFHEYNENTTA